MQVKCGTYTGNTTGQSITGIGFQPDLVIVEGIASNANAHFRISAMAATKSIQIRGDSSSVTDGITSLDSDGFTVGTSANVNFLTASYYYIAVRDDGSGDFAVGSFTGDAADDKAISVGFDPNYILVKCDSNIVGASKYAVQTGVNASMQFGGGDRDDLIRLTTKGFSVNNGSGSGANLVNVDAVSCYWFAFKEVADFCEVFNYVGNSTDSTDITTPGFQPGVIIIKRDGDNSPVIRTSAHSGDNAQHWDATQSANKIQSILSTGFQVGEDAAVNTTSANYRAFVLKEGTSSVPSGIPTVDASSNSGAQAAVSTYNWSHTCSGSNRLLVVSVSSRDGTDADRPVTGVTYNSVAMTKAREDNDDTLDLTTSIWYLIAPSTGSNTIAVTHAGTVDAAGAGAVSLNNVDQTTPLDASSGASGTSTTATASLTATANTFIFSSVYHKEGPGMANGASEVQFFQLAVNASDDGNGGSYKGPLSAGSQSMTWTDVSGAWCITVASFKPATAAAATNSNFFLMFN